MRKLISLFILLTQLCNGQIKISGQVLFPAQQVNLGNIYDVLLYQNDSTLIEGKSFTTKDFELETPLIEKGFYIKVAALGFKPITINLEKTNENIDLGKIKLVEDLIELNEITIKGQNKIFESNNGNLKFNVASSGFSKIGSGMDVVAKLPGVVVDNEKVRVLGKGVPLIVIDDREVTQKELEMLPSDQIQSVELVRTMGAEYSASNNVVLKITTKKQKYDGWNLKLINQFTKATYSSYYSSLSAGYKKGKSFYFLYFGTDPVKKKTLNEYDRYYSDTEMSIKNEIEKTKENPQDLELRLNTIHDISKKLTVYFQTNNRWIKNDLISDNKGLLKSKLDTENISVKINNPNKSFYHSDNLHFIYRLDSLRRKIQLNINYSYYKNDDTQKITQKINNKDTSKQSDFESDSHSFSVNPRFEYNIPSIKLKMTTGAKWTGLKSESKYKFLNATKNQIEDNILASYIQLNKKMNPFTFILGLRYEWAKSSVKKENKTFLSREYSNLFPNASVEYSFNNDWKTNLYYAYRISRPNLNDISTYQIFVDPFSTFNGNPKLLPDFSHVFDYSLTYKGTASLNVSYVDTKDKFFYYIDYDGLKTKTYLDNFDFSKKWTFSLNLPYQNGIWTIYNSLGYVMQHNKFEEKGLDLRNNMFYASIYNRFNTKKWGNFSIMYQYNSSGLEGLLFYEPRHIVNLTAEKKLWKNRIELYLNLNDIFNKNVYHVTTSVNHLNVKNYRFNDQQKIQFGVVFKLNNKNYFVKETKNNNEDERIQKSSSNF